MQTLEFPANPTTRTWRPILDGDLRDRALESVADIAEALQSRSFPHTPALAGKTLGHALLSAYMREAGLAQDDGLVERLHGSAVEAGETTQLDPSLYSGLAGLGWATEQLRDHFAKTDGEAICDEIDEQLADMLRASPWTRDFDLICGLVGFGVYALERLPREGAVAILEQVIERLAATAIETPDGLTWWTDPNWLMPETRERFPHGYYNLGLAHGVPGVVALLGQICAAEVGIDAARPLLDRAVRWLLAQQPRDGSAFAHWIDPHSDVPPKPARLAWCYGDPGIASALLLAARCANEPSWEREAIAIARRAAICPLEKSGVKDAGLCHGSTGLGHVFNRLYHATGDEALADASRFWFEQTLSMRRAEGGIAGYSAYMPGRADDDRWVASPDLLEGAAGVALALLAASTEIAPDWDRMLMTAIPPNQK